jgi:hypothetical protein
VRVLVDGRDDQAGLRVRAEPVALAVQVPLRDLPAGQGELDDGGVKVAGLRRLALRADAVLEGDEDVPAKLGDVVRAGQRLGARCALAVGLERVVQLTYYAASVTTGGEWRGGQMNGGRPVTVDKVGVW